MSAKESDELFDLIHTLTKAERRYFKLHFEGNSHSDVQKYMRLFDAIAAMIVFDKSALDKKFKGEQIIKYYSKTKAYVFDAILDSLRAFRRGQSVIDDINIEIANMRILQKKGLNGHFERLLITTKQFCYETEQLFPLLDILDIEETFRHDQYQSVAPVNDEIQHVLMLIQERDVMTKLHRETYAIYSKYGLRPTPEAKEILGIKIENLLALQPTLGLHQSYLLCYSSIAFCQHCLGNHEMAYRTLCQSIELYDTRLSPRYFRYKTRDYIHVLGNTITYAFNTRSMELFSEAQEMVQARIEKVQGYEEMKFGIMTTQIFLKISLQGNFNSFAKEVVYVEENQELLSKVGTVTQSDIIFNVSLGYLKIDSYDNAIRWLTKLFDVPSFEGRIQIYLYARLYEILLHWRLNNTDLVISRTLSFKRYLTKRGIMGEFEKVIVKFINAATYNDSTKGFEKAMNTFAQDLEQLDPTQYSGMVAHYSDLLKWFTLDSKL